MKIVVTGGAGFIGSALIRYLINETNHDVINVDKLTYAGNLESLASVSLSKRYSFVQLDICDKEGLDKVLNEYQPELIMHLAAESHVDRSIDGPAEFIQTNIVGTFTLLSAARQYWDNLPTDKKDNFIFHHISTDEVYGDLNETDLFTEETPYAPSSPYSASKASSDHLVRAWHRTYGLPVVLTNCSNNYGPYQFPEKLIPLVLINILHGKELPIYGDGKQIRDWLYVEDHARGIDLIINKGRVGETYNIGGHNEWQNIDIVTLICDRMNQLAVDNDELKKQFPLMPADAKSLITFVTDRPGHDLRYAIDAHKSTQELGYIPEESFETGINKTIDWYMQQQDWWRAVMDGSYQDWISSQYNQK